MVTPCILCLKVVGSRKSSSTSLTHDPLDLCHLLTLPSSQLETSSFQEHLGGNLCFLCVPCEELIKEMKEIQEQIGQLQNQFGKRIILVRSRILKSKSKPVPGGVDEVLREILLKCSGSAPDDNNALDSDGVEVKIEGEDGFDDYIVEMDCSPESATYPDEEDEEDDGDLEFIINPHKATRRILRRSTRRKATTTTFLPHPDDDDDGDFNPHKETWINLRRSSRRKADSLQDDDLDNTDSDTPLPRKKKRHPSPELRESSKNKTGKIYFKQKQLNHVTRSSSSTSKPEFEESQRPESDTLAFDEVLNIKNEELDPILKPWKCTHCSKLKCFVTEELLAIHVQNLHPAPCLNCDKRFRTRALLEVHHKKEHVGIPFIECNLCKKRFYWKRALTLHMVMAHETADKFFNCDQCGKGFTLELNFNRHLNLHKIEDKKPIVCEICDCRFKDQTGLDKHSATHTKSYYCAICDKDCGSSSSLLRHRRMHAGEKHWKCDHCGERFFDFGARTRHIVKHHSTPEEFHPCQVCGRSQHDFYMKKHLDSHKPKPVVTCDLCGEVCTTKLTLKTHQIDKHGADPFICDECGAHLKSYVGLAIHKKSHSGEKPFKCDVCGAGFRRKNLLANHMPKHTGERAHPCPHCDLKFKTYSSLFPHVKRMHTEGYVRPTPHECSYLGCGKKFQCKSDLEGHVRQMHTMERPFRCEVCDKGFATRSTLNLHRNSVHGILTNSGSRLPRTKKRLSPNAVELG